MASGKIKVTLIRSIIGRPQDQKDTITALGLRRINHSVIKEISPQIMGMINKVSHLVTTEKQENAKS